jgi:hypothetical protein
MLIKLTNATIELQGIPILINSSMILSAYRTTRTNDSDQTTKEVTHVFCPPHGTWEVEETVEEIESIVKAQSNGK